MDFNNLLSKVIIKLFLIKSLLTNVTLGSEAQDRKLQGHWRQASALTSVSYVQAAGSVILFSFL